MRRMLGFIVSVLILFVGIAPAIAEDAFSILKKLEVNYVGLEKPGLKTLIAKAECSVFPDAIIMVYWSKDKGLKTKIEGGGPGAMASGPMVKGFVSAAGLGTKKTSEESKLTEESVVGTHKLATLADGSEVTELTFIPKEGQELGFTKMIMMVDTKEWVVRQSRTITEEAEVVTDIAYENGLPSEIVSTAGQVKSTITNTYMKQDEFTVPVKTEITMEGPDIPENMKHITVTYSDINVNAEIPEEIFAEPKPGEVPKPTETAAELFQQAQAAMGQGDLETAKLKLRQIVTYYPDDPMAPAAEAILEQLPK